MILFVVGLNKNSSLPNMHKSKVTYHQLYTRLIISLLYYLENRYRSTDTLKVHNGYYLDITWRVLNQEELRDWLDWPNISEIYPIALSDEGNHVTFQPRSKLTAFEAREMINRPARISAANIRQTPCDKSNGGRKWAGKCFGIHENLSRVMQRAPESISRKRWQELSSRESLFLPVLPTRQPLARPFLHVRCRARTFLTDRTNLCITNTFGRSLRP